MVVPTHEVAPRRGGPFTRLYHWVLALAESRYAGLALAVIAFIWYMFWGYKTNGQAGDDRGR